MSNRWTEADLKKLPHGMVTGISTTPPSPIPHKKINHKTKQKYELGVLIYLIAKSQNWKVEEELRFLPPRRFKFDWAIPEKMIAIEYEGLSLMGATSGHTTIEGYTKNCEKYNLAQLAGWKVLRYTALNWEQANEDLKALFSKF